MEPLSLLRVWQGPRPKFPGDRKSHGQAMQYSHKAPLAPFNGGLSSSGVPPNVACILSRLVLEAAMLGQIVLLVASTALAVFSCPLALLACLRLGSNLIC